VVDLVGVLERNALIFQVVSLFVKLFLGTLRLLPAGFFLVLSSFTSKGGVAVLY